MNSKFEIFNINKALRITLDRGNLVFLAENHENFVLEEFSEVRIPQNNIRMFLVSFFRLIEANVHFSFTAVNEFSKGMLVANTQREMESEIVRRALYDSDVFELKK